MARFPRTEPEVAALAEAMITGLTANAVLYPAPPVAVLDLTAAKTAYITALNAAIAAKAVAETATVAKDDTLEALVDAMKTDLRYAENTVDFDDAKLNLIGWAGGRRDAISSTGTGKVAGSAETRGRLANARLESARRWRRSERI